VTGLSPGAEVSTFSRHPVAVVARSTAAIFVLVQRAPAALDPRAIERGTLFLALD
jgi:hypothetical protein